MIGLAGQYAAVDEVLTGMENLVLVGRLNHLRRAERRRPGPSSCSSSSAWPTPAGRQLKTYSGGMRRRLDLAAALVARPPVLFLDEPTTGLDPRSRIDLWAVIEALVADGVTLLLTTQYLEEADRLADRICVIDHGRVIAEGTAVGAQGPARRHGRRGGPAPTRPRPKAAAALSGIGDEAPGRSTASPCGWPPRRGWPPPRRWCAAWSSTGLDVSVAPAAPAEPRRGVPGPHWRGAGRG